MDRAPLCWCAHFVSDPFGKTLDAEARDFPVSSPMRVPSNPWAVRAAEASNAKSNYRFRVLRSARKRRNATSTSVIFTGFVR